MEREEAIRLLEKHLRNPNLIKHALACESIMAALARKLGEDPTSWSLVGLLHDIDYEQTKDNPAYHGLIGAEMLADLGLGEEVLRAIKAHNPATGFSPQNKLEWAIFCVDPTSGFIVACALIHPQKKLAPLDLEFLLNRFKEKSFARGADREQIRSCEKLGLSLEDFLSLSLAAMKEKSQELGL
ncbi:HDIG domain-containing metalloprotein [Atrimonas thermophila]|uniref:HDIG domain-containing metalloprotein n=1 Tax=Atrimonas thermophila TaxID=3064161 RepID=UPI00399D23A2